MVEEWSRKVEKKAKPKKKQGLTTGDVVKMLDGVISQSTVSRYLDQGILTGWKNQISGKRLIDPKSVEVLAKKAKIAKIEPSERMESRPRRGRPRKMSKPSNGMVLEPNKKQGLTTGEVSRMLGGIITQRTVIRFFDKGILTGRRHPVTGQRVIDRESVEALKRKWKRNITTVREKEG